MIQPGTLLQNRYRVIQEVGKGGMGEVYLATDERFQSRVAIKRTFFGDLEMSKAFRREAKLLNHLRHAALPKVSDHFSEDDGQFLVMEFIEGFDFAELLTRRKVPFPLHDVLRWADELLDALEYLHTQKPQVIHRDIKPPNIKLTPQGKVMLLDFGLAKGAPTPEQTASGTAASVFGFSMNFAPLEQMQGSGTDARSDLYSLAATLYSLLTGVRPPDALTRASATIRHQPDPLRPAHLIQAQVPASVSKILHRAMAQNPALRQTSAAELRAELRRAANGNPQIAAESPANPSNIIPKSVLPGGNEAVESFTPEQEPYHPSAQEHSVTSVVNALRTPLLSRSDDETKVDVPRHQRFPDSYTVVRRDSSQPVKSKGKSLGLAACLVVVCVAVVAYLLTKSSGVSSPEAQAGTEIQNSMPASQQPVPAAKSLTPTGGPTTDTIQNAPEPNISSQSASARITGETSSTGPQASAEPASTPDPLTLKIKEANAGTDGVNGATTSTGGKPVLMIQNPTPAKSPEEAKQEQPTNHPEFNNQPPPGQYPPPPPPGWPPPPPPNGRQPPPPFRPPNR